MSEPQAEYGRNVWCKHIVWINDDCFVLKLSSNTSRAICRDEMFCALCGKPRPEEKPRELWEVIKDASKSWGMPLSKGNIRTIASAVLDWFLSRIPKERETSQPSFDDSEPLTFDDGWNSCLRTIKKALQK